MASALIASPVMAHAGELRKASDAVQTAPRSDDHAYSGERHHSSPSSSTVVVGGDVPWQLLVLEWSILIPFYLPHVAAEAERPPGGWSFGDYPYANDAEGYLVPNRTPSESDDDAAPPQPAETHRSVVFQAGVEGLSSINASYGRLQGSLRMLTKWRTDIDAAYSLYMERGNTGGVSSAWLGGAHLTFRFAENEHVHFRAGAGFKHWSEPTGWALGPDLLYGIEIFWGKPMTTSLEATAGLLGHGWSTGARGSVGVMIGQAELYAGYDGVWIGASHQPTAFLGGPIAGFRAYF